MGVVTGYRRAQLVLAEARSGARLTAWWDSLGLDAEQQVWMARLWEVFRTSHTVAELDERLGRYEEAVVEALGAERSGVLLWGSGVLYSFGVLLFGRAEWVEEFWVVVRSMLGEAGGGGGMARWGVLGGRGWIRLAQQHTTCELNSMPQIGDYRTVEGALATLLERALSGCLGGAGLGAAIGSAEPGLGTAVGAAVGCLVLTPILMGLKGVTWYLHTVEMYRIDLARWCRENYSVCQGNEHYERSCREIVRPE
ncbi:MAG: hypothetical protein Q9M35_11365 [Rhodothermus sp.]|nr:hypothetical protein [Rhodothermus sp.]